MITAILIFMVIVAILLIIIILIQNPKGGGISSEFGGGGATQMFGVQKTGDILEQLTWGFFAFILVAALATGILSKMNLASGTNDSDVNIERSTTAPSLPVPSAPAPVAPTQTLPVAPAK